MNRKSEKNSRLEKGDQDVKRKQRRVMQKSRIGRTRSNESHGIGREVGDQSPTPKGVRSTSTKGSRKKGIR